MAAEIVTRRAGRFGDLFDEQTRAMSEQATSDWNAAQTGDNPEASMQADMNAMQVQVQNMVRAAQPPPTSNTTLLLLVGGAVLLGGVVYFASK